MAPQTKALLDQILNLSEDELDEFLDLLYERLEAEDEPSEEEWGAELLRRREEALTEPAATVPGEVVRGKLRDGIQSND